MKWLKISGLILLVLIVALAAIPLFVSLEDYVPTIEKEISARLKEPVKIGSLKASGLPLPHATVTGIVIGKTEDVKVGKVTITPDLWSLMSATKVIKRIEIDGLVLTQKALDKIPAWTQPPPGKPKEPAGPPPFRVESIRLDDAVLKLQKVTFGPFDARLSLAPDGTPRSASLASRDGRLKAQIQPERSSYLIEVHAKGWTLPVGPALQFDELVIKGVATLKNASLDEIRARLYGGSVSGKLVASWDKAIQVKGNAEVNQVEVRPVLRALGRPPTLSGRLTARPVAFSASAAKPEQLAAALRLETPFDVQNGVLHGVDIGRAATTLVRRDEGKSGETRFDKLSGHLAINRGTRRLTQLEIASGALSADGNVTISPKDELSGRINAKVKAGSVAAASVPLNVAGTVDKPLVLPTAGTVAGAAVGTAVLGPGVGTSVGSAVGRWTEGLFGKKEEKK